MPNGKSPGKHSRQLLFSEAIAQPKPMASPKIHPCSMTPPAIPRSADAREHILQEITDVGRRLEAMDLKISDRSAASTFTWANIACFQVTVTDLYHPLTTIEDRLAILPERARSCSSFMQKSQTWRTGVGVTMSVFVVYWNKRKAQMSKPFSKTSYPNSQASSFPCCWTFKGPTESAPA
ncbi:hypothetical protein NDU88_002996 [Pleurodeles waltl]|uniref:Uncharacterized protein n=1 Tax=Pleurodeles waltl TaxID=8319 RepID=A0AAV7P8Q5_PLEWA|nr:hypothetical protein NDU88_002996 [Pleurodeles waltl]